MQNAIQGIVTVVGRSFLAAIFLLSAAGNKIPNFSNIAQYMGSEGVPAPQLMLVGAIAFLLVGSLFLIIGYRARFGASLLFVFLILATYFFHDFWTLQDPQAQQEQMIQFMKNLGLMGAMLLVMANGSGPLSLDKRNAVTAEESSLAEAA